MGSSSKPPPFEHLLDPPTSKLAGFGSGLLGRAVSHAMLGRGVIIEELGETGRGFVVGVQFAAGNKVLLAKALRFVDEH